MKVLPMLNNQLNKWFTKKKIKLHLPNVNFFNQVSQWLHIYSRELQNELL